jgi:quercetin dioxygenase-like cupin family protein
MYRVFLEALRKAGVPDEHLTFFRVHIACDDEHARTLSDMLLHYAGSDRWLARAEAGMERALSLRAEFFDAVVEQLQARRLGPMVERIQARASLAHPDARLRARLDDGASLYENQIDRLSICFSVHRLPFGPEVLDPRVVRIPPGKCNERHRHAHETIFYIVEGAGTVTVDRQTIEVHPGDVVFVPRWSLHQSECTGPSPLTILAVTDYGLTSKTYLGDYTRKAE